MRRLEGSGNPIAIQRIAGAADRPDQVRLAKGQSLAQIAKAKGKSNDGLVAAMVAPAKNALAKAVSSGRLTQQRADQILARLTDRVEALVERVPAKKS